MIQKSSILMNTDYFTPTATIAYQQSLYNTSADGQCAGNNTEAYNLIFGVSLNTPSTLDTTTPSRKRIRDEDYCEDPKKHQDHRIHTQLHQDTVRMMMEASKTVSKVYKSSVGSSTASMETSPCYYCENVNPIGHCSKCCASVCSICSIGYDTLQCLNCRTAT